MMIADFINADPLQTADALDKLAHDLRWLAAGVGPHDLSAAPMLRSWKPDGRVVHALSGTMHGHPNVEDGRIGLTSEVFAICPQRRWVRTFSRFYVLGPPANVSVS